MAREASTQERAQQLPFTVAIVDLRPEVLEGQRRTYRSESTDHELLFCVEAWTTTEDVPGVRLLSVTRVRREREGRPHHIDGVRKNCRDGDGKSLPMFHTHSDGNCQFSPGDLVTIVARDAAFEGVQCGERHYVWNFAWQILAIATAAEKRQLDSLARR